MPSDIRNNTLLAIGLVTFALAGAAGLSGCDVDVEDEGELPEVDVDVKEGRNPDIDVHGPDVDVGTKEVTVPVPDVDVDVPDEKDNEPPSRQPATPPSSTPPDDDGPGF